MVTKNSLAAVSISNRLSERHDIHMNGNKTGKDHVVYVYEPLNLRFIGRYCTIKGERSGGYVLRAALNERYGHEPGPIKFLETRLRKGWTPKTKQRAIHRMIHKLAEERTMKRHREQVYQLAESRDIDLDRIDKIAAAEGREIEYSKMTVADCEFWKVELAKFPKGV